ncbi:MAG: Response regulator [Dehalococcoidia bacterium]|nr:Response regulator [Dehalococcoidia bacterium]
MIPFDEHLLSVDSPYTVFPPMTTHRSQPMKVRILVVDDEAGIRDIFKETLEECGYACLTAPSGEAALEVLSNNAVDVLLLDILMPGMSGLTCFEYIREMYPDVAVVFVTATDDVSLAVRNMRQGAYDYLVKPLPAKRLVQTVKEVLVSRNIRLVEKQQRELLEREQAQQLDQRGRELEALNRLFQQHLRRHSAVVQAYQDILDRLGKLAQQIDTRYELARAQLPPELMKPFNPEGDAAGGEEK